MSVNFGFGGSNSAVVVARHGGTTIGRPAEEGAIVISGLGAFGALGEGIDAWADAIWSSASAPDDGSRPVLDPEVPDLERVAGRHWRRMDRFSRLCLAAATGAVADAGLTINGGGGARILVVATESGPADTIAQFNRSIGRGGRGANPSVFMNCSPNAAAGYLGAILHTDGGGCTLPGGGIGAAVAIATAAGRLRRGAAELALVVAADHLCPELVAATREAGVPAAAPMPFGPGDGTRLGGAAIGVLLERQEHAAARGASTYCTIGPWGAVRPADGDLRRGFDEAMSAAMSQRGAPLPPVDYLIAAATGIAAADQAEADAICKRFTDPPLIGATTHLTGTCLSASGAINVATAAVALRDRGAAPFAMPRARCDLPFVGPAGGQPVGNVLVNSSGRSGSCASIMLIGRQA